MIGAGVVGLACARAIAATGRDVVILESNETIGMETSSRNSEVIHAGIYYPQNSLKANTCIQGKKQLYEYCTQKNIPYKNTGKLIVASNDQQLQKLHDIKQKAAVNGVNDLVFYSKSQINELAPGVNAQQALYSPSTGIIDSHAYMISLLGDAEAAGAMLAVNSKVISGTVIDDSIVLKIKADIDLEIKTNLLINCAGLHASKLSKLINGITDSEIPETYYRKGNYFTYSNKVPFRTLVYPVPEPGGLGIHSTMDLGGQTRFGPNVEWIEDLNYDVNPDLKSAFVNAIRSYWPEVDEQCLQHGYAGIRPSLADKQGGWKDFVVKRHNVAGDCTVWGLYGIESPGLTASLAIAQLLV